MRKLSMSLCLSMACGALFADGVTRSVEMVEGGCRVTLAWEFSGKVESGLVIEERYSDGWTVEDSTVPFSELDASWFSGGVARFAVKPELLGKAGSISFTVVSQGNSGNVTGDWKMYLDGTLRKGDTEGECVMSSPAQSTAGGSSAGAVLGGVSVSVKPIAITSFKIENGAIALSYGGIPESGTLVVEGCKGLGKDWVEIKRTAVGSGDGKVRIEFGEANGCSFFKMKLLAEQGE